MATADADADEADDDDAADVTSDDDDDDDADDTDADDEHVLSSSGLVLHAAVLPSGLRLDQAPPCGSI